MTAFLGVCKSEQHKLSCRVIFELLWRDYFKFVAVKYGNRMFHIDGKLGSCLVVFLNEELLK